MFVLLSLLQATYEQRAQKEANTLEETYAEADDAQ